ncbi:MAG TPA: hypothetical protein PLA87_17065 [Pseudomonadota bacterium]|jgi:hypothetical protein|nr:hypothetical protein [Deltaproteobacteria bacterium]HPH28565.1 hypothetical protein [Pseudomonadota bacterium]
MKTLLSMMILGTLLGAAACGPKAQTTPATPATPAAATPSTVPAGAPPP